MRTSRLFIGLLTVLSFVSPSLLAQPAPPDRPSAVPTLQLTPLDNVQLLALELEARKPGRAPAFARVRPVDVRPTTHGNWTDNGDGTSTWRLRVNSPNAHSLNLGFTEYWMPAGGELYLTTGRKDNWQVRGPFTPADNEAHNQLWTPMVEGEELIIEVSLPTAQRSALQLWLTHVNHDFLDFNRKSVSGSCNLDVICDAGDGFPIVDLYRDIIRSVAVISTGGGTFCTGFLVNNTRNDGTPYFMTANHCGINAGNAPSLVTYWNFENSSCRQPNSTASGGNGDGVLNVFNSGAVWRASNPPSDMTIVELDDPVNPDADAFFAGWDRTYNVPTDTVIAIHHPRTDEKRISFTFQQTFFTAGFNGNPDANSGTHLEIPDWDIGTTEPGSSGSPVYDRFHRVRGQLHGGGAACGNDLYDSYGAIARSWEGGGSSSSRLRDWLDPDDLGPNFIDGRDANAPQATVNVSPVEQRVCGQDAAAYNVVVGGGFGGPVQLSIENLPAELNAAYSQNPATPGSTIVLTITPDPGTEGQFSFDLAGSNGPDTDGLVLRLSVDAAAPEAVIPFEPAAGAMAVSLTPTLSWGDLSATNYEYQLATNVALTSNLQTGTTAGTAFMQTDALMEGTTYFWRVRAVNACGTGEWSPTRSFTTLVSVCRAGVSSSNVPVSIPDEGDGVATSTLTLPADNPVAALEVTVEIDHTYVGDLQVELSSPDGITVMLVDRIGVPASGFGCSGNDLVLTFNDQEGLPYEDLENSCGGTSPTVSGTYRSFEPLSLFNGEDPGGVWTLTITDNAGQDIGTLQNWSIIPCEAGATLPVELSAFSARTEDCGAELNWSASLETGFAYYGVEQSVDGRRFTELSRVQTRPSGSYDYRVETAPGTRFFRLRLVDADGSVTYSPVVTTTNDCGKLALIDLYPNPVAPGSLLTTNFDRPLTAGSTLEVYNPAGQRLLSQSAASGQSIQQLRVGDLPAGTYFLRVVTGAEVTSRRFVVR